MWLANGGGSWGAGFATNNMVALHASLPGFYYYAIPGGQLDHDAGLAGYIMKIEEGGSALLEYVQVTTLRRSAWDDLRADHTTANTFGEGTRLADSSGALNASQLVDAVWDEPRDDHTTPGTFGDPLTLKKTTEAPEIWKQEN